MSGGSFNYLCHAAGDAEAIAGRLHDLGEMAAELEALDDGKAAARATRDVIRAIGTLEMLSTPLADVWQAVEWWRSNDYSEDQVHEQLAAFNYEHGGEGDRELSRAMTRKAKRGYGPALDVIKETYIDG